MSMMSKYKYRGEDISNTNCIAIQIVQFISIYNKQWLQLIKFITTEMIIVLRVHD